MADKEPKNHPHFIFQNSAQAESFFTSPVQGGGGNPIPDRDRNVHGSALLGKLQQLTPILNDAVAQQRQAGSMKVSVCKLSLKASQMLN